MKFRMITTFFGAHSFGGDAAYVDRLSQALCRRGHEVHVYYCVDAFNAVRGDHPLRSYTPPPGLHLHPLKSSSGILSPLATQATGLPLFKTAELREALDDPATDVVHFHNISLVGGPGVLGLGSNRRAVRIMTAHEHWLICPMHLLWKFGKKPCDVLRCHPLTRPRVIPRVRCVDPDQVTADVDDLSFGSGLGCGVLGHRPIVARRSAWGWHPRLAPPSRWANLEMRDSLASRSRARFATLGQPM